MHPHNARAVEELATTVRRYPRDLKVEVIEALASRLGVPVLVGDDTRPIDWDAVFDGPSFWLELRLSDNDDLYAEGGVFDGDVVQGAECVMGAALGLIEEMSRRHPIVKQELQAVLHRVMAEAHRGDSLAAITEVGGRWTDLVGDRLDTEPHRQAETFGAAHAVVERLIAVADAVTG